MDADVKTDGSDKRLNNLVAVTVVILSVFMAVSKIKDETMSPRPCRRPSRSLSTPGSNIRLPYQAARRRERPDATANARNRRQHRSRDRRPQAADYEADIKKYEARSKETRAKAEALEKEYDRLNFGDDQFDMSDAFLSIAIAVAAVAALADSFWLLYVVWASGAVGFGFGIAGFLGLNFRPEWLAQC